MSPAPLAFLLAILGSVLAAQSAACVVLWRRARALGRAPAPGPSAGEAAPAPPRELARRLDDLERRHKALEDRLARVEAAAPGGAFGSHPAGPRARRRADRGEPTLIAVPNLAAPPSPASEAASGLGRRFGDVWALVDAGVPAEVVARETGYPIGQVELILGLRRQVSAGGGGPDA